MPKAFKNISDFSKLLLIHTLRPDRFNISVKIWISKILPSSFFNNVSNSKFNFNDRKRSYLILL